MAKTNPHRQTSAAAAYCLARGVAAGPSFLQKARRRGPDDPGDKGPDFYRDAAGVCWYPEDALDAYIEQRLGAMTLRARGFRRGSVQNREPTAA